MGRRFSSMRMGIGLRVRGCEVLVEMEMEMFGLHVESHT